MKKGVVIALGGNALLRQGQKPSIETQFKNAQIAMHHLLPLLKKYPTVITFGNGPQVGNILLQVESAKDAYTIPLEVAVAESEGELGYLIEQSLRNELQKHRSKKEVTSILTQVLVDKNDPLLKRATKPIGPFYTKAKAKALMKKGMKLKEDAGRGWRRVVPSPLPKYILEAAAIKKLMEKNVVIAAGGGGIPVYKHMGKLKGVEAVIDKDFASAQLATQIGAEKLLIITGVKKVYLNYKAHAQQAVSSLTIREAEKYLREKQFAEGSMKPKIEAAVKFLRKGGKTVIITSPECITQALKGKEGTRIYRK